MSNDILTAEVIAREAAMLLSNRFVIANLVYRDYEKEFSGSKKGEDIIIREPADFEAQDYNGSIIVQDISEGSITLTLELHVDISVGVTSKEWTLSLDDFSNRVIARVVNRIANRIDAYMYSKYVQVYNFVGAAGSPPDSLEDLTQVDQILNELLVPEERSAILNPAAKAKALTIPEVTSAEKRGDEGTSLRTASIGHVMAIDWYWAQGVKKHVSGNFAAGSPAVNSTVAEGDTSMNIDGGAGAETIKKGDIFTVDSQEGWFGVFTADATASGGAITGATFAPEAPTGGFADGDVITIVGDHTANLAFAPNAFALAIVPLEPPKSPANSSYINYNGIGIRVTMGYDMDKKKDIISFDVLCGAKCIDPRQAVRILG